MLFGVPEIKAKLGNKWFLCLLIISILISLAGSWKNAKNKGSVSELNEKNLKLKDQKEHLEGVLASLPEEFSRLLSMKWGLKSDSRITIYRYDSESFIPVSRYSKNPDYDNINRESYPKDVGYISKCWTTEEGVYIKCLPDPMKNEQSYIDYVNKETKMLKKDLRELTMKSRSYYGKTLFDENEKALLIVMVESTKDEIHNIEEVKSDLEGTMSKFVISLVNSNITPGGRNGL